MAEKKGSPVKRIFDRYFISAMSAMAYGLFASLIIGTIIEQLAKIPGLVILAGLAAALKSASVYGAVIGAAIAWGLKTDALVMLSAAGAGAIGCAAGGPVGAYVAAVIGAEIGQLVSKRTPMDILVTPLVTVVAGGLVGQFIGPYIGQFMDWLGYIITESTKILPLPMGIIIGAVVGMVLTAPISSAALCIALGLDGLAAGAAVAGCCAQMIGFAVTSFRDNGVSGLLSQGIGTSMLQMPNIMRRPQIWIAPTIASAVCGGLSTTVFMMSCDKIGAGMGTSGLVGQITTYSVMTPQIGAVRTLIYIALLHFIIPGIVALGADWFMRRGGLVKAGDMKLTSL